MSTSPDILQALKLPGLSAIPQGVSKIVVPLTPTSVAADTTAEENFTVHGLNVGDFVSVSPPSLAAGAVVANARVSAANTLTLQFVNSSAAAVTPPAGNYLILVVR